MKGQELTQWRMDKKLTIHQAANLSNLPVADWTAAENGSGDIPLVKLSLIEFRLTGASPNNVVSSAVRIVKRRKSCCGLNIHGDPDA